MTPPRTNYHTVECQVHDPLTRLQIFKYNKEYFDMHKDKSASIWKGIRSLVNLKSSSKKDISIVEDEEITISDQVKICNQFNNFFVNIGQHR